MTDNEKKALEVLQELDAFFEKSEFGGAQVSYGQMTIIAAALDEAEARAVVILERRAKELDDLMVKTGDHSAGLRATALRDAAMEIEDKP